MALRIEPVGTDRRVRRQNHECASALIWFALRRALRKAFVVGDQREQQSLFLRINCVVSDRAPFSARSRQKAAFMTTFNIQAPRKPRDPDIR